MKKYIWPVLVATFFLLSGCSVVQSLGDYVNENPIFADIATRQAVGRYIAAGDTPEAEAERAEQVETRVTKVLTFLDGNPEVTVDTLLDVVDATINWNALTPPDRMLVTDILKLVEMELREYEVETSSGLSEPARLALRDLLTTAISAAAWYAAPY